MKFGKQSAEGESNTPRKSITPGTALGSYWLAAALGVAVVVTLGLLALAAFHDGQTRQEKLQQSELQARLLLERVSGPIGRYTVYRLRGCEMFELPEYINLCCE